MDNKAKLLMELKNNSHFDPFSCLTQLPGITYFSSKDFVDFDSRKLTYNSLLESIKDDKNKMIGLYAMGGSGKTTLAKEVGKKVHDLNLFEKVVMVVVSKPPNVAKIQQEIAEQIDLEFQEETQFARAQRLSERLKNKKILVILDDVWEYLRLEDIGIPPFEGCHVLLTTRLRNVCVSMDCETMIELPLITEEEAWELFKKHANLCNDPSNMFDDVGRQIIDECKGLPIAIVTVGRSLRGKPTRTWESELWRLKHIQPLNVEQGLISTYACLEFSYDSLPTPIAKSLFLLCSMFPEDQEIHKEDLIRFGKRTLEIEETIVTMEDARREILDALEILLDSCLLMHTDKQACVKIHDLVRDVGIWIAKKQCQAILVDNHAVSNMVALNDTKTLSLWNLDENFKLSNQLCFPTLEILLLQPHGFIEDLGAMKTLKVLALITNGFGWHMDGWLLTFCSIPRSIISTNLHTLCLREKNLGDISFLSELKGLETLDLRGSQFDELPVGIVHMKLLKLLDIFNCEIEKSPLEVIGRCEQLEELYFWDKISAIPETFSRSMLKRYVICDSTCSSVSSDFNALFMEYFDSCDEALRALCIKGFQVYALGPVMKNLILRANILWLENCRWDQKDINFEIEHLVVSCCQEKRFIIENLDVNIHQIQQVFSHLISLRLIEMKSLEQVFQDSSISFSLPMLQEMSIRSCPELRTCIFNNAMIKSIPKLRKLEIHDCGKVKWLFSYSLASHCPSLEELVIIYCSKIERLVDEEAANVDRLHDHQYTGRAFVGVTARSLNQLPNQQTLILFLSLKVLSISSSGRNNKSIFKVQVEGEESIAAQEPLKLNSELQKLCLEDLAELEYIWNGPTQIVSLHKLEEVILRSCSKLKNIFTLATISSFPEFGRLKVGECEEWEGILCEESLKNLSSSSSSFTVCFPKLKKIDISNCNKVRSLLSYSLASHCPSLEELNIFYCSKLERVVDEEGGDDMEDNPNIERAFVGVTASFTVCFPKLKRIEISCCNKVRSLLSYSLASHCPSLETLDIVHCEEWKGIFCEESLKNISPPSSSFFVCFPKLKKIHILNCNKVRSLLSYSLASHCPSLETLDIEDCSKLERVVDEEGGDDMEDNPNIDRVFVGITAKSFNQLSNQQTLIIFRSLKVLRISSSGRNNKGIFKVQVEGEEFITAQEPLKLNSELHELYLRDMTKLEYIWKGSTQIMSLHKLEEVILVKCPKLKNIFTLATVLSLPELWRIYVSECKEWEGIFCEELLENLSSSYYSNVCFPKLEEIYIYKCHKVRRVFSYSLASHCPSLKDLTIKDCSEIEVVVKAYIGEVVGHHDEKLFPMMIDLKLRSLPKLREIYPNYELTTHIDIEDCPNVP